MPDFNQCVYFTGKASTDISNPDYAPSLLMGYAGNEKLTPEGKKARFARLKKRGCQREEYERDVEQQAEAASALLDLSVSSQPSEPDVDNEPLNNKDASCTDTGKDT